jgi:hypothetical protein
MSLIIKRPAWSKPAKEAAESEPARVSLVGPETIVGTVREIAVHTPENIKVRLWNDASDRTFLAVGEQLVDLLAIGTSKPVSVTVEKLRGRWTLTKVENGESSDGGK